MLVLGRYPGEPAVVGAGDLVEESADPAVDADSEAVARPDALNRSLAISEPDGGLVPGQGSLVDTTFVFRQRD